MNEHATPHRHRFVSHDPYRVCAVCRAVQRKVGGRWVQGARAANPTEQKNIARRVLDEPIRLPLVPEPVLTPAEKAVLAEEMRDPAFWDEFEQLPEPNVLL